MKIKLNDGTIASIEDESSTYCIVLINNENVEGTIGKFTDENLSAFQLLNDDNSIVASETHFTVVKSETMGGNVYITLRQKTRVESRVDMLTKGGGIRTPRLDLPCWSYLYVGITG